MIGTVVAKDGVIKRRVRSSGKDSNMPTVKGLRNDENVVLTGAALNVVDCFRDGLDEIVVEMAEEIARARHAMTPSESATITIEARDVNEAGNQLFRILREQIAAGKIPASMLEIIQNAGDCMACK